MPPKEWPYCYTRGFVVNPLRRCVKCRHKKHLIYENEEWSCLYEAPSNLPRKKVKLNGTISNPDHR